MRGLTQKYILECMRTKRYTIFQFDRASGRRLSTHAFVNPLTAFNEVARMLPVLDRAVIVVPSELGETMDNSITLEQAIAKIQPIRSEEFHWA